MMRAVWVDAGNDADYAKLRRYGIDSPYYDIRDPRVTHGYLRSVRDLGFHPGIFAAWNWSPRVGGAGFAGRVSLLLQAIAPDSPPDFPKVCLDIETHSVTYVLDALTAWRQLRPSRVTDWTLEGFQGGLFSPRDTIAIASTRVGVVPQAYSGNMKPTDPVDVIIDLCAHSFAPRSLSVFYDAATLRPDTQWSGYAFTQGRLS